MPSPEVVFSWIEIDIPQCSNTFGSFTIEPVAAPSVTKNDLDVITDAEVVQNANLTFSMDVVIPASPVGVLLEMGGSAGGLYLGFTGSYLLFQAGNGALAPNPNTALIRTLKSALAGKTVKIVCRVQVSNSTIYLTIIEAGKVITNLVGKASAGFTGGVWAGVENGCVGNVSGTVPAGTDASNFNGTITNTKIWNSTLSQIGGCIAKLSAQAPNKCWQLRGDCGDLDRYTIGTPFTLRFCFEDTVPPKDGNVYFPVLDRRITTSSASVNIAGSDPDSSGLGRQSNLSFSLQDFMYHERGLDKYLEERLSGAAQFSGIGYDPENFLYLSKLKSRIPDYSNLGVRFVSARMVDGVVLESQTRKFYMTEWNGPNGQTHSFKCRGVTNFSDKITALAPRPSSGRLQSGISAAATSFVLEPVGIGASEYPASGELCLGNEVMSFTRSGETFTVVRGQANTVARAQSAGVTAQLVLRYTNARPDTVMNDLVDNYTETPATYLRTAIRDANAAEVDEWATGVRLTTRIVNPTPVGQLLGELSDLGFIIWEDEIDQSLNLRANRPFSDSIRVITDTKIKQIETKDSDDRRLTQVRFFSRRYDPTKSMTDESNYESKIIRVNPKAFKLFQEVRSKTVYTRWLDQGDENTISIVTQRYLNRFSRAPRTWEILLDASENDISLVDVIELRTDQNPESSGDSKVQRVQVFQRKEPTPYHDISLMLQQYRFDGRYGKIAPASVPSYSAATEDQKTRYGFIAPREEGFDDGTEPYRII